MKRYLPFVLILGFLALAYGFLTLSQDKAPRGQRLAQDALDMLALCEEAISAGELPDVSGWDAVRTNTATSTELSHHSPPGTDLAVQVTRRAFGAGVQLSCSISISAEFGLASEQELAVVLMAFMQLRGAKLAGGVHKEFLPTALGQGWVQVGYGTKVPDDRCPVGSVLSIFPEPGGMSLSVADRFTWCG